MMIRTIVGIGIVLASTRAAHAIERNSCPTGQVWSLSAGSCVKKKPAPKLSPQEKFDRANDDLENRGKAPDPRRGVTLLEQACASDKHAASCTLLGFLYARGRVPLPKDDRRAMEFFQRGCELGDLDGCYNVGDLAYRTAAYPAARLAFDHACTQGAGIACARQAELIADGIGGGKDAPRATKLYQQAMTMLASSCTPTGFSDGRACYVIGLMHEGGRGTTVDKGKALNAYKIGCGAGSGNACMSLATGLDAGLGGSVDTDGANKAYERACTEFDNGEACQKIAERLGMAKVELDRAVKLAERACQMDPKHCGTFAEFHRLGFGLPAKDQKAATRYYKQACENGGLGWCGTYAERAHDGTGLAVKDIDSAIAACERACKGAFADECSTGAKYLIETKRNDVRAAELAMTGCNYKNGTSCYRAGWLAEVGRGGDKDPPKAYGLYEKACGYDSPVGCYGLGTAFENGFGTEKDLAKAYAAYKKGCEGNETQMSSSACGSQAGMAYRGEGVAKDVKAALAAMIRACEKEEADTCKYLPQLNTEAGGKREDILKPLGEACDGGFGEACMTRANVLTAGTSETERAAAYKAFEKACGQGTVEGCLRQGDLLLEGRGVTKDLEKAERIYKTQCDAGNAFGCTGLGSLLRTVGKHAEAHTVYQRACEAGGADACMMVGWQFKNSSGARWDIAMAAKYYSKACELESTVGCSNLGGLYRYGQGVALDHKKALALYEKTCRPGVPFGCDGLGHYLMTGEGGAKIDKKRAEQVFTVGCSEAEDQRENLTPESCVGLAQLLEARGGSRAQIARYRNAAMARTTELASDGPYYVWLLGTFHRDGMATVKDAAKALELFSKSCEAFNALGCIDASKLLLLTGKAQDGDRARVYLERACAVGVEEGCALGGSKAPGPSSVGPRSGCCSGEVAPGAEGGLVVLLYGAWRRRRRRR
jgi:uncharacterized protein